MRTCSWLEKADSEGFGHAAVDTAQEVPQEHSKKNGEFLLKSTAETNDPGLCEFVRIKSSHAFA